MKNVITYLKALWSWGANSQSSDVGYDCRLTVGSPSGLDAKLQVNTFMRFAVVLTLIFTLGIGNAWGAKYSWTCTGSTVFSTSGSELNGITWKASITGASQGTGVSGEKCVQIAKMNGLTLETTDFNNKNITEISIQTWGGAGNSFALKDGDEQLATTNIPKSYSTDGAKITFNNVGVIGTNLVFSWTIGEKTFNVRSITVTYEEGIIEPRPSLSADETELAFGNVTVNSSQQLTFTLSGSNLTANATLTISGPNEEMFSVSPTSVNPTDGSITSAKITVTYNPSAAGDHTATLTISSTGAESKTVTLSGTGVAPANVVNWSVKGVGHTTEFNDQNTPIYQLTDDEKKCGEKDFIGWTAHENYKNATDAPDDLFTTTLPSGVANGTTFYAVYADTRTTTSITYTWDLLTQSTTPALAVGDQIVITAKEYKYALSTTQNTNTRGAVAVTKNSNSITINDKVQIFTIENGNEEGTFALAAGNGYLSGTRRKAGWQYYNQLITAASKSANASWYIGFTEETTPYIYNEVTEKKEYPNYYVGFYDNWWTGTYYFEAVRDASILFDYNPKNISIYRKTQTKTEETTTSGYTTNCGCTPPAKPLAFSDQTITADQKLTLVPNTGTGNGGAITYTCSDATHTKITDDHVFSATALGSYTITATQAANNENKCGAIVDFKVTVKCATPSITPETYETTINTPVDLKSIIKSTSPMPLTFACENKNVYISETNFTFLAAGTYTITATQEAGGIYCDGSQKITITVTDPCAKKDKPNVTAGAITTDGFTLSWPEITGVSTYRVYNNTTGDSDETTKTSYPFSGLNPSTPYSWTVEAVYSDGCTAATSGTTTTSTPVVTYTVNWNVAGSSYGSSTTVNHGEQVSALPTAPDPATYSCGDKVFVGWSKSQYLDGTRPADLFTTVAESPAITADATFYAVFADCVTGGDTPEDDTQGEWTLVTNVNDLQVGDKIIIACYSQKKAAGDLISAILSVDADVTFSNNGNTLTPSASTLIFTLGGSTDAWTLANSSGQLLGATAVKKLAWDNGTTTWSISISGNNATIQNGTSTYGRFLYNVSSPRFTTYTSDASASMLLPQIYKKTGSGSGGGGTPEPEKYTVTLSVLGATSKEETTSNYTLPIDVDASCAGKTFVGWTTTKDLSSPAEPTSDYWAKGTSVTITENKTYYAVFAEGTNTFEWVTTGVESGADYLLAVYAADDKDYVLKNTLDPQGYIETVNINAIDYVITTSDNSLIWTIVGNSTLGYYIYNPASDKYLNIDAPFTLDGIAKTRYSITMSKDADDYVLSYIKYENYYCYLYNDNTIGIKETEASIYLYKRAYSNFSTKCDGGGSGSGEGGEISSGSTTFTVKGNTLQSPWTDDDKSIWTFSGVSFGSAATDAYFPKNSSATVTLPNGCVATQIIITRTSNAWSKNVSLDITSGEENITTIASPSSLSTTITLDNSQQKNTYTFAHNNAADNKIWMDNIVVHYTSTSASAPARKVAMKKVAAVRAEKSEMVTRPVVKAPAALAAQGCTSYENYTTICCKNPITDLKFAAGANSITLYWNTASASATATLYSDEACETQVATQSGITNGTCTFTGLAKTTTYYAKVTTADGCTAVLEVSTERPHVSVAEWAANQINIDVNTNEPITVVIENEVTGGSTTTSNQATELFFSKYYEATANVKLVAVYNGTPDAIDLTNYTIKYGKTSWATNYIPLAEFATTANGFAPEGHLSPGEEMILYTKNVNDSRDVSIMECVTEAYPDGKWIEVTTTNNAGKGSLSFGGDKVIALFNGGELIDIIGAGDASKPDNSGANTIPTWGDAKGWTCDEGLSIDDGTMIGISTNRCLLVRNNTVTSGDNAVKENTSDFVTLCTEWKGAHVPDDDIDKGVAASCENFAFVGTFDYSDYYVKYEKLRDDQTLGTEGRMSDGTYKVTTPDLHAIACTNMRISLKDAGGKTLVTQDLKVPIIVDQDIRTDNKIYFQYTQRETSDTPPADLGDKNENVLTPDICAECDIVIRDSKTLTHVQNGRGQFRNMMVYPNAKMDNQAKQPFNLNTLQMQGQNDAVSYAIIENDGSTIDVGDMVFVKRIDDKYWYNFSLPYDCKVADIIQQNGQSMGKYWVDWGIKEYDGKARQEGGTSAGAGNVGLYWKKVEETATLKAHQGYIIGLFTTEWTNQMKFVYFTPTNTNPYREAGVDAKKTTIDSWYTPNQATVAARHRGWNFTGSPYISRFGQSTAGQGLNNTALIMTGKQEPENSDETSYTTYTENVYVTIPSTQGGKYYSHSVASGVELLPFTAYFVQAADVEGSTDTPRELTYAKDNRALPAPARTPAATKQRVLVELLVTAPDGQTDNTGVWVDERYTPEYEIAADLGKMYVAGVKPQLYTLAANGDMMAYHALPDASAMNIPLRLYAPKAGDYTLTLNQRVSRLAGAERVELLYNNAVVANMMIQDYTITANRGTVNGYSLSITRRADVSTAIDNITGTTITVIANDGYISVTDIPTDAQVSVYDMLGRLLATQSANGQTVVNIPAVPQGVYNIVVGNNNGHTTIKTVIR